MLRQLALAATTLIGLAGAAVASDLSTQKTLPQPPPAPIYDWTGSYFGIQGGWIGGGRTTIDHGPNDPLIGLVAPEVSPFSVGSGLFGVTDGYNWQAGGIVYGLESDTSFAGAYGRQFLSASFTPAYSDKVGLLSLSTERGRLGYLIQPNALLYATGGVALANEKFEQISDNGFAESQTKYAWGYALGAGAEWKFTPSLSLKAEYMYVGLAQQSFLNPARHLGPTVGGADFLSDNRVTTSDNIVRVGLNYRFDLFGALTGAQKY
jgi:outer membrane immunogenic protein